MTPAPTRFSKRTSAIKKRRILEETLRNRRIAVEARRNSKVQPQGQRTESEVSEVFHSPASSLQYEVGSSSTSVNTPDTLGRTIDDIIDGINELAESFEERNTRRNTY